MFVKFWGLILNFSLLSFGQYNMAEAMLYSFWDHLQFFGASRRGRQLTQKRILINDLS